MKYFTPVFERLKSEKQERILAVAAEEFAALGYRTANINIIADKCDVSVGSLYKYFGTKENLFLCTCSLMVDALRKGLDSVESSEGGFFDKIEQIIRIVQEHSRQFPGMIHLYNEVTTQGNSELAAKLSSDMESISAELYTRFILDAKNNGEVAPDLDERMTAFCLDNLFMTLQFSYATEFYRERMKTYVDDGIFGDDERVLKGTMEFIRRALEVR